MFCSASDTAVRAVPLEVAREGVEDLVLGEAVLRRRVAVSAAGALGVVLRPRRHRRAQLLGEREAGEGVCAFRDGEGIGLHLLLADVEEAVVADERSRAHGPAG